MGQLTLGINENLEELRKGMQALGYSCNAEDQKGGSILWTNKALGLKARVNWTNGVWVCLIFWEV
jgi:hypothetical protein